jgi:hypothetical protein
MKRDPTANKDAMVSFRTNDEFKKGLKRVAKDCRLSIGKVVELCVIAHYSKLLEEKNVSQENTCKQDTSQADKSGD